MPETGLPRITSLGSWVDSVAACVSESPRQGIKKEAGLDLWIMCRRGCQPGNNDLLPLLPLPIEALNAAIQEPSTRARGVCKYIVSALHRSARVGPAGERAHSQSIYREVREGYEGMGLGQ